MLNLLLLLLLLCLLIFGPSLLIPIPCVYVATVSGCVDCEVVAVVVHAVVVPFVPSFVNLLVYAVIGAIPIDLFQNKLMPSPSPKLSSLIFH